VPGAGHHATPESRLRLGGPAKNVEVVGMKEYEMNVLEIAHENAKRRILYSDVYDEAKKELVEAIVEEICNFEDKIQEHIEEISKKYAEDETYLLEELLSESTPVREIYFFTYMLKRHLSP